jgi:hypothetical protein
MLMLMMIASMFVVDIVRGLCEENAATVRLPGCLRTLQCCCQLGIHYELQWTEWSGSVPPLPVAEKGFYSLWGLFSSPVARYEMR